MFKGTIKISWSEEDQEYVATCDDYPSLSWLAPSYQEALEGLLSMILDDSFDDGFYF